MTNRTHAPDESADVVVVGGGPTGCSVAVFTARYGLDSLVFDRGTSSLARCAYLENYLGFPAGIDVGTLTDLMHDHVAESGGEVVPDLVERVERADGDDFLVGTQDGRTVRADAVVATTKHDADYLRPLDEGSAADGSADEEATDDESTDGGSAMFETHEHDGEVHEQFDSDYPDDDGRTPIDGLYVAGPLAGAADQAIVAAGHGASVARELLRDRRRDRGYWDPVAGYWDWLRRRSEIDDEATVRDHWRAWAVEHAPDGVDLTEEPHDRIFDREIERRLDAYIEPEEAEERAEAGKRRLAEHLPDDLLLDAVADERIRAYAASLAADASE